MTCTATFGNGATIIMERITTNSRPRRTLRVPGPALSVFVGVGRVPTTRSTLVLQEGGGVTCVDELAQNWEMHAIPERFVDCDISDQKKFLGKWRSLMAQKNRAYYEGL